MEVYSDQPGVQLYTSNYMPDEHNDIYPAGKKPLAKAPNSAASIVGKGGARYNKHGAFCLETQKFPDAVNHVRETRVWYRVLLGIHNLLSSLCP